MVSAVMLFPPENHVVETEHVESGQARNHHKPCAPEPVVLECGGQNLVLGEEAGEGGYARDGQTADKERDVGDGHILAQTVHGRIVVGVYGMYQSTGAKEQQSLEHGVGEQMEHRGHEAETLVDFGTGDAERCHHERNLRDGREREHALDVNLCACHHSRIECGDAAHDSDDVHRRHLKQIEREQTGHQVHTGHNHRCGMDEGRHGSRAFHSIGEPDVERKHSRLTHTSHEDKHESPCESRGTEEGHSGE